MKKVSIFKQKARIASIGLVLAISGGSSCFAQWPVFDFNAYVNDVGQNFKEVAQWAEQKTSWVYEKTHRAAEMLHYKEEIAKWTEQYGVLTQGFDMINDVKDIYDTAIKISTAMEDIRGEIDDIKNGGLSGITEKAFGTLKEGIYKGRSKAVTNSCGKHDALIVAIEETEKRFQDKKKDDNKLREKYTAKAGKKSSSLQTEQISLGLKVIDKKIEADDLEYQSAIVYMNAKAKMLADSCVATLSQQNLAAKRNLNKVSGTGFSFSDTAMGNDSSSETSPGGLRNAL